MRVVHLSTSDNRGGAARVAYRLHRALVDAGVDSQFVVSEKTTHDPTVTEALPLRFSTLRRRWRESLEQWPLRRYPARVPGAFSVGWGHNAVWQAVNARSPDVVHLHWVNHGFLPIADVPRLHGGLVWSLHDQWPFTGGCHYSGDCTRYAAECGDCPALRSGAARDLSTRMQRAKLTHLRHLPFHLVCYNRAAEQQAQTSAIFQGKPALVLPIGINPQVYRPIPQREARRALGLGDGLIVGFGAVDPKDARKGFDLAVAALQSLGASASGADAELCCFGGPAGVLPERIGPFRVRQLGVLNDDIALSLVYSATDAMLISSRQDMGPQTAIEALACGTPLIGFRVGMLPELIAHGRNGYLVPETTPAALADGLRWIATHRQDPTLRVAARASALATADLATQVPYFLDWYERARAARRP